MSRSPTELATRDESQDYAAAFRAANRMVNEGMSWSGSERNRCFLNTGNIRFANISATSGLDFIDDARAIATVDWDEDGDLDLFQVNRTAPQIRFLRNQWKHDYHWLALRLVGTHCNRDAIGARVELYRTGDSKPDIRTVRAGTSFLSQSSKTIHFGLGSAAGVDRIVVHWPGQQSETFRGIQPDRRYRLVQASGKAQPLSSRSDSVQITGAKPVSPKMLEHGRAVLSSPVLMPKLNLERVDGGATQLAFGKQPTLLQLWASWCPMCQAEMSEFSDRVEDIRRSGIRVVAVSVDGLGTDTSTRSKAREAAERMQYPFILGHGTEDLLRKLEVLRGELFANLTPFPVPTTFLVDDTGRLRAVYLGPMTVDQLLVDAEQMKGSDTQWRDFASPMPGSWFTDPKPVQLTSLAKAMDAAGYADDARWYRDQAAPQIALKHCSLALDLERQGNIRGALTQYQQAIKLDPNSARAYNLLGKFLMRQRQMELAKTALKNSAMLDRKNADTRFQLGTLLVVERQIDEAIANYRTAIEIDPDHAHAHAALGRLLQQQRRMPDAIHHLESAIQLDPTLAPPYVYLGIIRANQNKTNEAIGLFRQAISVQPQLVDAHLRLAELLLNQGKIDAALDHYRLALRSRPNTTSIMGTLAWHMATQAAATKKNPREAVELAEQLVKLTHHRSAQALDILAATHADVGEFDRAIATLKKALELQPASPQRLQQMRQRLALYQDGKPFRVTNQP